MALTGDGEVVEVDGRRYIKIRQHHPVFDERGRHVDWKWTHMALVPLEDKKEPASRQIRAVLGGEKKKAS